MIKALVRLLERQPATASRSESRRCIPRLEPLDGRVLPSGFSGGTIAFGGVCHTGAATGAHPTADSPAALAGGTPAGAADMTGGAAVGGHYTAVQISRSGGEEIPQ
jgi:hypothetical protein